MAKKPTGPKKVVKPVPAVGSTSTKPPKPVPKPPTKLRLTVHVVRVKFGGLVATVEENVKDATVEVLGQIIKKTAANGKMTTQEIPPGKHVIKVFKAGHGPVPKAGDPFVPDFTVIQETTQPAGDHTVKIQVSDGSSAIIVNVFDGPTNAKALGEAEVEVVGTAIKKTNKAGGNLGRAVFEHVPFGARAVKVRKVGFGPIPAAGAAFAFGEVVANPGPSVKHGTTAVVELHMGHPGNTVTKIEATIKDTVGMSPATILPAGELAASAGNQRLKTSLSADPALATNKPVVVVRGSNQITLTAITNPAGNGVDWKVVANENKESPPSITPSASRTSAVLSTNKTGSFAVIAADGDSKIIWNVVFAHLKVKPATSRVKASKAFFFQSVVPGFIFVLSGQFVTDQAAWQARVDMEVIGGGADGSIGAEKIDIHYFQNGVAPINDAGAYIGPPTAVAGPPITGAVTETPPNVPILDATGGGGPVPPNSPRVPEGVATIAPIIFGGPTFILTALGNRKFRLQSLDSPGTRFPFVHSGVKVATLRSVSNFRSFRAAVAATSKDSYNNLVVVADLRWQARYDGNIVYPAGSPAPPAVVPAGTAGSWVGTTNAVTAPAQYSLVSDATGGQDAVVAGFRILPPRFNAAAGFMMVPS